MMKIWLLAQVALVNPISGSVFRQEYLPIAHVRTDPIISQTCLSDHVHSFYGPPHVYPGVTEADLLSSNPDASSGTIKENLSLYWHPSVYQINADGTRELADQQWTSVYYNYEIGLHRAFPPGFRMIGGRDPVISQSSAECVDPSPCRRGAACNVATTNSFFPTTACQELEVGMSFPGCWDGVNLDSPDHTQHVHYVGATDDPSLPCPSSHPVRIPIIAVFFRIFNYPGGPHEFSDGTGVYHSDYIAGWDEQVLQNILDNCELEERINLNEDYCNGMDFPFTYRGGVFYNGDDGATRRDLQRIRKPLVDTSCITTEAIEGIQTLPTGECKGDLLSQRCDNSPTTPAPFAPVAPPSGSPPTGEDDDEDFDDDEEFDDDTGIFCFSPFNTVSVRGKGDITIDALRIGDYVETPAGYTRVISFGHLDSDVEARFLQVKGRPGEQVLEVSKQHIVHTTEGWKRAVDLKVGDSLETLTIHDIEPVYRKGIYAPTTESGELLVSGVRTSCFSSLLDSSISPWVQHTATQIFHSPLRLVCYWNFDLCKNEKYDDHGFSKYLSWAAKLVQVLSQTNVAFQMIGITIVSPTFLAAAIVEHTFFSPSILAAVLTVLCIALGRNAKSV